jgi:predicted nuclease with TOPRIM domain
MGIVKELYEISNDMQELLELAEGEEVDTDVLRDTFEALEGEYNEKIDSLCYAIKAHKTAAAALKEESDRLSGKVKSHEASIQYLKSLIAASIAATGKEKLKTDRFSIYGLKSDKLEVVRSNVPDEYKKEVVSTRKDIDNDKIKAALDKGEQLSFARYISSCTIR